MQWAAAEVENEPEEEEDAVAVAGAGLECPGKGLLPILGVASVRQLPVPTPSMASVHPRRCRAMGIRC